MANSCINTESGALPLSHSILLFCVFAGDGGGVQMLTCQSSLYKNKLAALFSTVMCHPETRQEPAVKPSVHKTHTKHAIAMKSLEFLLQLLTR